jgi:hypothetical protein
VYGAQLADAGPGPADFTARIETVHVVPPTGSRTTSVLFDSIVRWSR